MVDARLHRAQDERHRGDCSIVDCHDKSTRRWQRVAAVREAVGPHSASASISTAACTSRWRKVLAKELEPYRLMFIEEPVLSEHVEALQEIAAPRLDPDRARRAAVLALGLQVGPRSEARWTSSSPICRMPAASPRCRKIAAMAEAYDVAVAPALPARPDRAGRLPAARRGDATTRSSRSRASASTTTPATICSTTPPTRPSSAMRMAMSPFPMARAWASRSTRTTSRSAPRKATAGATRSGATRTAPSRSGSPADLAAGLRLRVHFRDGASVTQASDVSSRKVNVSCR